MQSGALLSELSDIEVQVLSSIEQAESFFKGYQARQPFQHYAFWQSLEKHAANQQTGWKPSHLLLLEGQQPIGFLPLFIKSHQRGEYVFDHAWADAYARYGLDYFPRLVSSIPFTPVVGERLFLHEPYQAAQLWPTVFEKIKHIAQQQQASSWHGLFMDAALKTTLQQQPDLAIRSNCQFLWCNQGYQTFDDFLQQLTAKKRKNIKVERKKLLEQGLVYQCKEGRDISAQDWEIFYQCYVNTYYVRGQKPYLPLAFFLELAAAMPQCLMLMLAYQGEQAVAAALFFKDAETLYGRYWGELQHIDLLHFELCYYQGIEYAIRHHLQYFDPGTQGEHKLIRGFAPVYTYSAHWLALPPFMQAVRDYCQQEARHTEAYYQAALDSLPFKKPVL